MRLLYGLIFGNALDSLLAIGKADETLIQANKLQDNYQNQALDKIKKYEVNTWCYRMN